MRKNSKCAIYKLKEIEGKDGSKFYDAVVVENIYNSKKPHGNWEMSFVKCTIFTDLPLEIANWDLELDKNPYAFVNISNPEHSIIRVLDFSVESQSAWRGDQPVKDSNGKQIYNQKFYVNECEFDTPTWKSEESKLKVAQKKLEEHKATISELRKENNTLKKEIEELKNIINNNDNTYTTKPVETKVVTDAHITTESTFEDWDGNVEFDDIV